MKVLNDDIGIIGCISVAMSPEKPKDQPGASKEDCPGCLQPMWVSDKKRELQKKHSNLLTLCMLCSVEAMKQLDPSFKLDKVEIVDIRKL